MPNIQGIDFEQTELEFLAQTNNTTLPEVVAELSNQPAAALMNFKKTLQQALANHLLMQQDLIEQDIFNEPVQTYAGPAAASNHQNTTRNRLSSVNARNHLQKITQGAQDALFMVLAKAKSAVSNFGGRWYGSNSRPPIQTKTFSFNPFTESFFNPLRNILVGGLGYAWLDGVVKSSSGGIKSVLEDTNAFSFWASLSTVQVAAMLLFLELMSDITAIIKKIKEGAYGEAGTKAVWDMIQNTLYFFTIYEFNKPWQILVATLVNILFVEKILEEKLFKDSFAVHARHWRLRAEPYFLVIISLLLSVNKTLSDVSLANASKFNTKDLIAVPQAKVIEQKMDLNPAQIIDIHPYPVQLENGKYLYIVKTAEKDGLIMDKGVREFRVMSNSPIPDKDMFGLMTLRYYRLQSYTPPPNGSAILELTGDTDAYGKTLIVEAKWVE